MRWLGAVWLAVVRKDDSGVVRGPVVKTGFGRYSREEFSQRIRRALAWHEDVRAADRRHILEKLGGAMYTGTLVRDLMSAAERITGKPLIPSADDFDNLCQTKVVLADFMGDDKTQIEAQNLWHKADILQEEIYKQDE